VLLLIVRSVVAIISPNDQLMEFLQSTTRNERTSDDEMVAMRLQSIESSDNGRSCFALVPPTKRVAAPAIAYKMLAIRRCSQLPLSIADAAVLLLLLLRRARWPCNERQQ